MISFYQKIAEVHKKRRSFQGLSNEEFQYLLADAILDKGLFASPNWNWRYGGVRYAPGVLPEGPVSKILVSQWPGQLGDVCMSAPVFSVLRQKYPYAEISFLSGRTAQEIFLGNPDVDALVHNPLDIYLDAVLSGQPIKHEKLLQDIFQITATLREAKYDLLINLQVLPMSASLARLCSPKRTIGMSLTEDGMPVLSGNAWTAYLFCVSANLFRKYNLLHRTRIFSLMVDETESFTPGPSVHIHPNAVRRVQSFFDHAGIEDKHRVIGLNPMSGTPIRQWGHFDLLARRLSDELKARVIVFGAPSEANQVDEIARRAGSNVIKATEFTLQELMAAICGCDLFITNDTGPMHLASILGRKVLALFGPTSFREVGPWGTEYQVLQASSCHECYSQSCIRPGEFCMSRITVDDVFRLVEKVLKSEPPPSFGDHLVHHCSSDKSVVASEEKCPGMLIQQVFERKNQFRKTFPAPCTLSSGLSRDLATECNTLKALLEKALFSVDGVHHVDPTILLAVHQSILRTNGILKPLVVINDLQFLDKRMPLEKDLQAFRNFSQGLLKDLHLLMNSLQDPLTS